MIEYDNPWYFNGEAFHTEEINKAEGFVYLIENTVSGKRYIGRKYFWQIRKVKGKKKRVRKESEWKEYYGSSEILQQDLETHGHSNFKRNILSIHKTRGDCNRMEVELQWKLNVLYEDCWYNNAIGNYKRTSPDILNSRRKSKLFDELIKENKNDS